MTEPTLTPLQLLAARRLLGWSRDRLAAKLGISQAPLSRFENEGSVGRVFDMRKTKETLAAAGVKFIAENGGGAGVRLVQPRLGGLTYLAKWRGSLRTEPRSHRFETKYAAKQWAFARIAEACPQVWIEDAHGKCIADFEELRRLRKAMSPR